MPTESPTRRIKILLGDEPSMWRDGLRAILAAEADLDVVGDAGDEGPILPRALKHQPDLVLCDSTTGQSALPGLRELRDRGMQVRVIVFTSSTEALALPKPFLEEVAAVVPKNSPTELLLHSIRKVNRGEAIALAVPPAAASVQDVKPAPKPGPLSKRERELVALIALGYRNREIADKLFISEQTVKNHLHNVFEKTGIRDRLELALYAIHHGLYDVM